MGEASSIDEAAPLWLIRNGRPVEIDRFPTSHVLAAVYDASGQVAYTREGDSAIYHRAEGRDGVLAAGLEAPAQLTSTGGSLYCLSQSKTRLYRVSAVSVMQAELLLADGSALLNPSDRPDGLQGTSSGTLLITSGSTLVELAPEKLSWVPLVDRPHRSEQCPIRYVSFPSSRPNRKYCQCGETGSEDFPSAFAR